MRAHLQSLAHSVGLVALLVALVSPDASARRYPGLIDPFGPPPPDLGESIPPPLPPPGEDGAPPPPPDGDQADIDASEIFGDDATADGETLSPVQLAALERFLEMPPEKLANIREVIQRIEQMSEEEKAALRTRIRAFHELRREKAQRLQAAHRQWQAMSPQDRHLLRVYLISAPPETREDFRDAVASLSGEARENYVQSVLTQARAAEAAGELSKSILAPGPGRFRDRPFRPEQGPR